MRLGLSICRVLTQIVRFYRRPVRIVGTIALLLMPAACAFCVQNIIPPQAVENTSFCAQYITEGKLDEAEARAKIAIEFAPKYAEAWNCRGLVEYRRGHLELAIEYFKRSLSYRNDFAEAHNNMGSVMVNEMRDYGAGEDQFRQALEIDPGYVDARFNLAMTLYYEKRPEEAHDQFLRCLELQPNACGCRMFMGILSLDKKDWADARAHFEKLVQICPNDPNAYYNLGFAYFQLGRCQEAYNGFVSALSLKPDYLEARKNLIASMDCLGKQDSAVERLMNKIRDNPGDPELHYKLGAIWEDKQQYDGARNEYLNVLRIKPDYKIAYYRLARLFDRNYQKDETIRFCQKFVDLLRDEPLAAEKAWCINRVKELHFGPSGQ
jgi:tetratricopeptide (TPR) repeat protein